MQGDGKKHLLDRYFTGKQIKNVTVLTHCIKYVVFIVHKLSGCLTIHNLLEVIILYLYVGQRTSIE
jgi:hypothetical protein